MSLTNVISIEQVIRKKRTRENLCCNLRQAIKVINADYQQIDWEDQEFLNRVLIEVLELLKEKEAA